MEEDKTFDQFYAKLNDIVNSVFNLGEEIPENKIVKEIMRFLPSLFDSKVIAIEENKNLDTLKVNQLVGNLQTFEVDHLDNGKSKEKFITLKTSKESRKKPEKKIESNSESEAEDEWLNC
ncbi:hypothetical protein AAC387_Pa09g0815 [Persea americana]